MKRTIGEIAEIVMGQSPKSEFYNNNGEGMPFLQGNRTFGDLYPTFDTYTTNPTKTAKAGDIIMSVRAPVGDLNITPMDMCLGRGVCALRMKNGNQSYLFYLLKHNVKTLINRESGTVFGSVNYKDIASLIVDYEENEEEQQRIGQFLWDIDQKIETNKAINNNLEQQARALFVSWFINFAPWNGVCPDEWSDGVLGDYVTINRGGSPRPIQDYLSDTGYRWLKISDATAISSPFILSIKEHIKESGLSKTVFLQRGALVLSNSATPGIPKILDIDSCIHDGWLYFPESKFSKEYLYLFFKEIRSHLVSLGNGSVFTNLKTDILKNYPVRLPSDLVLKDFDAVVKPLFRMILHCTRENQHLCEVRDTLIPKFLSGVVDVSEVSVD